AQRRYLPPGAPAPAEGKPWTLPVCVVYDKAGGRGEACTMLTQPTGELALPPAGKACPRWVMPNVNGRGYYRSSYTPAQGTALGGGAWAKLWGTERRTMFFDVVDAGVRGRLPLALSLSMVPKLLAGNDRFTVGPALDTVTRLDRLIPQNLRDKYELYLRQTF